MYVCVYIPFAFSLHADIHIPGIFVRQSLLPAKDLGRLVGHSAVTGRLRSCSIFRK